MVHGIVKSQTQLKRLSMHACNCPESSLKPFPDHKVIFPVLDKNEIKQWYSFVPGFFPSTLSLWKQSLLWYIPEICSCSLLFSVHLCEKTTLSIYPFCCWLPLVSSLGLLQIKTSFKFLITSLDEQSTLLLGIYLGESLLDFNVGSVQL